MKNTEKRQNTDCIFKQLSEGKEKKNPKEAITEKKDSCSQVLEKYQR